LIKYQNTHQTARRAKSNIKKWCMFLHCFWQCFSWLLNVCKHSFYIHKHSFSSNACPIWNYLIQTTSYLWRFCISQIARFPTLRHAEVFHLDKFVCVNARISEDTVGCYKNTGRPVIALALKDISWGFSDTVGRESISRATKTKSKICFGHCAMVSGWVAEGSRKKSESDS